MIRSPRPCHATSWIGLLLLSALALAASALAAPVFELSADSLLVQTHTGGGVSRQLTVSNAGDAPLSWSFAIPPEALPGLKTYRLTPPETDPRADAGKAGEPATVLTAALSDLAGVDILVAARLSGPLDQWDVLRGDLALRGANLHNHTGVVSPLALAGKDVLWIPNCLGPWYPDEVASVVDWVLAGGTVFITVDEFADASSIQAILSGVGSGLGLVDFAPWHGVSTDVAVHETTRGVTEVYDAAHGYRVEPVAEPGRQLYGQSINCYGAISTPGAGRIFLGASPIAGDDLIDERDNQLLANQLFDWLARRSVWLAAGPASGVVGPGGSQDIGVVVSAEGLCDPLREGSLHFTTNDPAQMTFNAPVTLTVTPAPDILFPVTYRELTMDAAIGRATYSYSFPLKNRGCTDLIIASLESDHPDITPGASATTLAPAENASLGILYDPTVGDTITAHVTITTDDPDQPVTVLTLRAHAFWPGEPAASVDSLVLEVVPGQTASQYFYVRNVGELSMNFQTQANWPAGSGDWMSTSPPYGTIAAGDSALVQVTVDASYLCAGEYRSHCLLYDAPVNTWDDLPVPVTMQVLDDRPALAAAGTDIDFGTGYVGHALVDSFSIENTGCDPLEITGIASDHADYAASPASFTLLSGEIRQVAVTFTPAASGTSSAILTVSCNAPDTPTLTVSATGEALLAPDVVASVDSLVVTTEVGTTTGRVFSIQNQGAGDADFTAGRRGFFRLEGAPAGWLSRTPGPGAGPIPGSATAGVTGAGDGFPDGLAVRSYVNELRVLWDGGHSVYGTDVYTVVVGDLAAAGATVTEHGGPLTRELLDGYHVLYVPRSTIAWQPGELDALAGWVAAGGTLYLEGASISWCNELLAAIGSGMSYYGGEYFSGFVSQIFPHEITASILQVFIATHLRLDIDGSDAVPLIGSPTGMVAACEEIGLGRVVASVFNSLDNTIDLRGVGHRRFPEQGIAWLADFAESIRVLPAQGTLPAGGSAVLVAAFDATLLAAGFYQGEIVVASGLAGTAEEIIPVVLQVTDPAVTGVPAAAPLAANLRNRPNPFNPRTEIRFELGRPADVEVRIYDARGREVRRLAGGRRAAGEVSLAWYGRDATGRRVASGTYVYRLLLDGRAVGSVGKMSLVK